MNITPSANPFLAIRDAFMSPLSCFAAVYQRPAWSWLAYILVVFSSVVYWGSYFNLVDLNWLQSTLTAELNLNEEQQAAWLQREVLLAAEVISDVLGRTTVIALMALWLHLATKQESAPIGYRRWLAASCFIFLPAVIGDIASYASILFGSSQLIPAHADLNSLNGLLKLSPLSNWGTYASSLPLLAPFYIAITVAALNAWTNFDRGRALAVALLPWIIIFGSWALFITLS